MDKQKTKTIINNIFSHPNQFLIFDTETTSINGEAIEVGVLNMNGETMFHEYVMPVTQQISEKAYDVHGIDLDMLMRKKAMPWSAYSDHFKQIIEGKTMIAYNLPFDFKIINYTAKCNRLVSPFNSDLQSLCAMRLRKAWYQTKTFQELGGDHNVIDDCLETLKILNQIRFSIFKF